MTDQQFFSLLTEHHGKPEPLQDTVSVLSYEVGKMMEQIMCMKWQPDDFIARMGFFKSELIDAIAQCVLICQSLGVDFDEMKELGMEKAAERFTGKEIKQLRATG